jgi:hypothetical protein
MDLTMPAIANVPTKCSIGQNGLSAAVSRALHEWPVWKERPLAALRKDSQTADKITV